MPMLPEHAQPPPPCLALKMLHPTHMWGLPEPCMWYNVLGEPLWEVEDPRVNFHRLSAKGNEDVGTKMERAKLIGSIKLMFSVASLPRAK